MCECIDILTEFRTGGAFLVFHCYCKKMGKKMNTNTDKTIIIIIIIIIIMIKIT